MNLFKPESFFSQDDKFLDDLSKVIGFTECHNSHRVIKSLAPLICEIANIRFNKWLKSQPDIFVSRGYGHDDTWHENIGDLDSVPSHRAKLVCVEVIEK